MSEVNEKAYRAQKILSYAIPGVLIITLGSIYFSLTGTTLTSSETKPKILNKAIENVDPRQVYVDKREAEDAVLLKRLELIEKSVQKKEETSAPMPTQGMEALKEQIHILQQELMYLKQQPVQTPAVPDRSYSPQSEGASPQAGVYKMTINVKSGPNGRERHFTENTIPSGAFAQGIILTGVDSSAATTSSANPDPMLIRVTDKGTLPRKFQSDLFDCHVTAWVHGDLSSRRVKVRAEKLTCVEVKTGEVIETEISAHVTGEDGKPGIKGVLVERSGDMMFAAGLSGFFSGMSSFLESYNRASMPFMIPGQNNTPSVLQFTKDAGLSGVGAGAKNSLSMITGYYIKKAEDIHPIIQVSPGRLVNLVFTHMSKFNGTGVRDAISASREKSRQDSENTIRRGQDGEENHE